VAKAKKRAKPLKPAGKRKRQPSGEDEMLVVSDGRGDLPLPDPEEEPDDQGPVEIGDEEDEDEDEVEIVPDDDRDAS
jgi:hypothetical protein